MSSHASRHYLPRHGANGRDPYPSLPRRLAIVTATLLATLTVYVGGLATATHLTSDPRPELGTVAPYADERWQDPSGYPYCTYPDDGLRPCVESQTDVVRP